MANDSAGKMKTPTLAIIGLGYVGLPLAVEAAHAGLKVVGVDTDPAKTAQLGKGHSRVPDVPDEALEEVLSAGRFTAVSSFDALETADAVSICVPTPLRKTKDPDLTHILAAMREIERRIKPGCVVILESTTYPGTTEELFRPAMTRRGLEIGRDVFVAFSPERVDPGNRRYGIANTPKIIGGLTPACGEAAAELYRRFIEQVVVVSSARVAEMVKLLENTFRSVNIALVNEMAMMCDRMGIDIWEVIGAAASKPFGFMPFYPGPGTGGHCIPLDPQYLSWKAKTYSFYNRFIELASDINSNMPRYVVTRVSEALNAQGKCLSRSRVLVLGVAYKKDVGDVRESPALDIMELLCKAGAEVDYHDPCVPVLSMPGGRLESVSLSPAAVGGYDCAIICTDHTSCDYRMIRDRAPLVVDTRNVYGGNAGGHVIGLGDGWQPHLAPETDLDDAEAAATREIPD